MRSLSPVTSPLRPALALLCLTALLGLGAAPRAVEARGAAVGAGRVAQRLEARLRKSGLSSRQYGVVVLTRGTSPRVVYAHNATLPLNPASSAKLLTSAAALDLLGPSHVFRTRLSARGTIAGDTLDGDLVLHGGADPNLSGRSHGGNAMYVPEAFAEALYRTGLRTITGALVLDEGLLDTEFVHPDWTEEDRGKWYGAPVGGLSFNDSCIDVELVAPTRGSTANLHLPATAGPWAVRNKVSVRAGSRNGANGRWVEEGRALEIIGRLKPGGKTSFNLPVPDPAAFLGGALLHAFREKGIRVLGGQRRARDGHDRLPGRLVTSETSELPPTLMVLNQRSQNFYASTLFKLSGAALTGTGSWASGNEAVRAVLERRHIPDAGTTLMRDGSGLSAKNRVSAGVLASLLRSFDEDILRGPLLIDSLPTSGTSGTLQRRLREKGVRGRVHAKTGTLNDHRARALAGYVDGRAGEPGYVFAILLNGRGASHALIDDLVRELTR